MKRQQLLFLVICIISLLFVYASFSKWFAWEEFKADMLDQPFPSWMRSILTWTLPPIEVAIVILLVSNKYRLLGFISSTGLMFVFTFYAVLILLNVFRQVPCSCGGIIKNLTWPQHLALNGVFLVFSAIGLILTIKGGNISEEKHSV